PHSLVTHSFERSLFVHWHFGQLWWLYQFFFLVGGVEGSAGRRDKMRSDEDDEVALHVLINVGAEKSAHDWDIADDRCSIFCLLHVFAHQAAEHDRGAVVHTHAGRHFARTEDRLINHVRREQNVG